MRERMKRIQEVEGQGESSSRSGIDLWRLMAGRSRRVEGKPKMAPPDSVLAVHEDRVTYTFILDDEVVSIHFDRMRGEIFFKGHGIHNLRLTDRQKEALYQMEAVLMQDSRAKSLVSDYSATLDRLLADNE